MLFLSATALALSLWTCFGNARGNLASPTLPNQVKNRHLFPLKCYQCDSYNDPRCADHFDNTTYPLKQCVNGETLCRKITQEVWSPQMAAWDKRYVRECAFRGVVGAADGRWCWDRVCGWRVKRRYCHCDNKDGCNAASLVAHFNRHLRWLILLRVLIRS